MRRYLLNFSLILLLFVGFLGVTVSSKAAQPTPNLTQAAGDTGANSSGGCVVTKVGNPTGPSPTFSPDCTGSSTIPTPTGGGSTGGGSNGDLINAAEDLVHAYQNCTGGSGTTDVSPELSFCLYTKLQGKYPNSTLLQFSNDYSTFYGFSYPQPIPPPYGPIHQCIQCIGFVRQALILAHGAAADTNLTWHDAGYLVAQGITQFVVGSNIVYKDMGTSNPQPGDVAIVANGGEGHINIVKTVDPSGYGFVAIEANYNPLCAATDTNHHTNPDAYEGGGKYHFFRKQ